MNQIQKQKLLAGMVRGFRIVLASVFIFSLGIAIPAQADGEPDLVINLSHTGAFLFFSVTNSPEAYTISVTNSGGSSTNGTTVTVTDTLPTGLTAFGISGSGWSCALATLTCTRSDVLNPAESYPDITLTVTVDNDAPNSVDNQASVSGGGEINTSNNSDIDPTTIAKSDLVITGVTLSPASPAPGQPFDVNVTVLNQGTSVSESLVYRDVYVDQNPSTIIDPSTGCPSDPGDYFRSDYNNGLPSTPPNNSETLPVSVPGLSAGSHQIWVYTDATCINNESEENNNAYGPINISIGYITDVYIGGILKGSYGISSQESIRLNYSNVDNGPVKVVNVDGIPIIAALRDLWSDGTNWSSSIQLMGMPASQISDTYLFPAYNNVSLDDQLRFANVGDVPTTVTVTIGGVVRGTYLLQPNQSQRVYYIELDSGPVKVMSSGGVPIIASIRDSWWDGSKWTSFAQLMGLPANQLSDSYYFPAYNNVSLDAQLRFGNVGTSPTTVTVTIGGVVMGNYYLLPDQSKRVSYTGVNSGPVVVKSSGGVPIITSLRDAWWDGTRWTSYVQLMGLPSQQLSDTYLFPTYDNVTLSGQLRFGNVGNSQTTVVVTIGGVTQGSYVLQPSESVRVSYNLDDGPVVIRGSTGIPIIASLRDSWWNGTTWTSFSQMMGLPEGQLSTTYVFPAYNNITYDNQLRIAVP